MRLHSLPVRRGDGKTDGGDGEFGIVGHQVFFVFLFRAEVVTDFGSGTGRKEEE